MKYLDTLKAKLFSIHRSFTNWFNVAGYLYLQSLLAYPDLVNYLSAKGLITIIIIGNVIIRVFKTSKAIEAK